MKGLVLIIFAGLLCCWSNVLAQTILTGQINDEKGEPIEGAMLVVKVDGQAVVTFGTSDQKGKFQLLLPKDVNKGTLSASAVGYTKIDIDFDVSSTRYLPLVMASGEIKLKTVEVLNKPELVLNKDTLNYKTVDFEYPQDRTIGDVLKRLPGIKIDQDGKIKYNGRPISNFYIDGDNVLSDRYNIGARIPKDAVGTIQVIERDQPIKLLRENNMSEDVALNLIIKDQAKLEFIKEAGLGLGDPKKLDGSFNAIKLGKKIKLIHSLSGNNVGTDPALEITAHNGSADGGGNSKQVNFLSVGTIGNPPLPQQRYLLNKSGLLNLNNFYKINQDLQAKWNISYIAHQEKQNYNTASTTFLSDGAKIEYKEAQKNTVDLLKLHSDFTLTANRDNYFFNNSLQFGYQQIKSISYGLINTKQIQQFLDQSPADISNELSYTRNMNSSHRLKVYSYINHTWQPEKLSVLDSSKTAGIVQRLVLPTLFSNNFALYSFGKGNFRQNYKLGLSLQKQHLKSKYDTAENDLSWLKSKVFSEASYQYSGAKFRLTLDLPLGYNVIRYSDPHNGLAKSLSKIFIDPALNLNYQLGAEHYISADYKLINKLGSIDEVFKGAILKNYRTLLSNDAPVSQQLIHNANVDFRVKNSLKMLFLNFSASYRYIYFNTISSYLLSEDLSKKIVIPIGNHKTEWNLSVSLSKYFFAIKSTVNAGVNFNIDRFRLYQNGKFDPFQTNVMSYHAGIDFKLNSFLSGTYHGNYAIMRNVGASVQLTQKSSLTASAVKNLFLTVSADHQFLHQGAQGDLSYLFTDIALRYRLVKIKADVEFAANNVGDIIMFESINFAANSTSLSRHDLPGRMLMIKSRFNF